jgi:predicted DNA-binding WGR domain protein
MNQPAANAQSAPANPPTPPPLPTAPAPVPSTVRHFEFTGGSSQKFWEITLTGNAFTVRFGRLRTAGQSQTKTFPDEAKARREAEQLIAEKVKKGYVERDA